MEPVAWNSQMPTAIPLAHATAHHDNSGILVPYHHLFFFFFVNLQPISSRIYATAVKQTAL
jgi:hypothetical protein